MISFHLSKPLRGLVAAGMLSMLPGMLQAMQELDSDQLGRIEGQQGISSSFEWRINADATGAALTAPAARYANCGSTSNFTSTGCRMAINFASRTENGGEWLVFKNFYGRIVIPYMYLDASRTPVAATSFVNLDRFKDENGFPLIASPNNLPAIAFTFPDPIEIWNLTMGGISIEYGATGYNNSVYTPFLGLKIGNTAAGYPALIDVQGTISLFGF